MYPATFSSFLFIQLQRKRNDPTNIVNIQILSLNFFSKIT